MIAADDLIGFLASALVLATFAMKDMRRLRATAVLSNIAFIGYGALNGLLPVLLLHLVLLPLNLRRLFEEKRALQPVTLTRSKATLLAIEALQHGTASRPETQPRPALRMAPEPRTRPLHQPTA
jgi:CRP/FNR family transcriptional regulator, cyclic AMP receptor protein